MHCTNPRCYFHDSSERKLFRKVGYYRTRISRHPVPRYQCKACGKTFSTHSFRRTYRQHRPDLNQTIFKLVCEGVTIRGAARILGCAKKTVERKFEFNARISRLRHLKAIRAAEFKADTVLFDEMETYERTKLLPLSIALALTSDGKIIETKVAQMKCKGRLARLSRRKYGARLDERKSACRQSLRKVSRILNNPLRIKTDKKPSYISLIAEELPGVQHERFKRKMKVLYGTHPRKKSDAPYGIHTNGRPLDPMFMLNQRCAKIRSQVSRMRRKFWGATKARRRLSMHLWMFTAWQNGYDLKLNYC